MPSVWKRLRYKLRRRQSDAPRSDRRRTNKQKIEPPNSPSSILQIEEIQQYEIPEPSSQVIAPFDDGISRLSIPSLIEDVDVDSDTRAGGVTGARNVERSFEVTEPCCSNDEKQLNERDSLSSVTKLSLGDMGFDEVDMELTSDGSSVDVQDSDSVFPYQKATEVPSRYPRLIGQRVKVRDSLNDARKRSKIGYIVGWKDSITVSMKFDGGDCFGVRLSSIEFVRINEQPAQSQTSMNNNHAEMINSTYKQEVPDLSSGIDSKSASDFSYASPMEVPGSCPSIIGMKVKVRDSLSDPQKRGKVGKIVQWKTRNTVSLECEDGQTFGVRLSSIDFVNQKPKPILVPNNQMDQAEEAWPDEISSQRSPKSAKSQSTETFVTARMDSVTSNDSSTSVDESSAHLPSHTEVDEGDQVRDKVIVPTTTLTKAPTTREFSTSNDSFQTTLYTQTMLYTEPIEVPAKADFIIGKRVKVRQSLSDSKKRGKFGSVVRWKNKSIVEIKCDDDSEFGVRVENIDFAHGHTPQGVSNEGSRFATANKSVRKTSRRSTSKADVPKPQTRTRRQPQKVPKVDTNPESEIGKGWIAPQNPESMPKFGGFHIEKLVVTKDEKGETTFLNSLLKQRKLIVEVPLSTSSPSELIERRVEDSSSKVHELVSCKIYEESTNSAFVKRKFAKMIYAQTEGPDLEPFAVDDYLLRVGDFTTIPSRKIAARLELFQSPSNMSLVFHEDTWYQQIPDLGYVGGGFIHEDTLFELLKSAGMKDAGASRAAAIQVRLFIPSMGVFKGMLVKKRIRNGAPIELPCSMQKVLQSTHPQRFNGACILICRNKVHPSPGSANDYIGRKFDETNPPPEKSFTGKIKKPLTEMIFRLWETMGVPKDLCLRYKKESLVPARRNHAWVVGVPDPTGSLPPDTVFVPGMKNQGFFDLFVTRCPCYAHEHGRKFRSFTEKPQAMSTEDWDWLNNELKFGVIIFSNPRPGMMSIPERIANGDLDGDLYLVCWDKEVVDSMSALPLVDQPAEDDGMLSTVPCNPNWFQEAQDIMIDNLRFESKYLIGTLYKLAEKFANESEKKLNDPDALALFEAYNEALEYQKHGRPIRLPRHLIDELKPLLRPLVEPLD